MIFSKHFNPPVYLSLTEQVRYCVGIIEKFRKEAVYLRKIARSSKQEVDRLEKEIEKWKEKVEKLKIEEKRLKREQNRLKEQKTGLILSLLETSDGTNNLAERELRTMVLNRKISNGSDTYTGMQTSATLGSIIQTFSRGNMDLLTELILNLQVGIHEKYPQYIHIPYFDSS